jgi:hypothetical protein
MGGFAMGFNGLTLMPNIGNRSHGLKSIVRSWRLNPTHQLIMTMAVVTIGTPRPSGTHFMPRVGKLVNAWKVQII